MILKYHDFLFKSADNKLFSRLIDSSMEITSVSLASAALADVINRNKIKTDKTTNKYFLDFIYYSPSKQRLLKESFYQFYINYQYKMFFIANTVSSICYQNNFYIINSVNNQIKIL